MEYKIYNASLQISKPPYNVDDSNFEKDINLFKRMWKGENTEWRFIGSVPTLEIARYLVEHDKNFVRIDGTIYELECEPSDEFYCEFVKIEYGDVVEYYDNYNNHEDGKLFERRFI